MPLVILAGKKTLGSFVPANEYYEHEGKLGIICMYCSLETPRKIINNKKLYAKLCSVLKEINIALEKE